MFKVKRFTVAILSILLFACGSVPKSSAADPAWISDPYKVYDRTAFIAAVGYGPSRDEAEKAALTNLTSIFGQSISSESRTNYTYTQAIEASSSAWEEKTDVSQAVKTSVNMDTLIGAEIKDVWQRRRDRIYYAVAVMDKAKTTLIYLELMQQNQETIARLTNLTQAEKESFEGYINYNQAATLADATLVFANVRNVISPGSLAGENLRTGNDYRVEAARIAKNIPIAVTVDNDKQNRIKGAFSGALSSAGFRTGGNSSRYVLRVNFVLEEVSYVNNPYRWIRYAVDANLIDTSTGIVLFPYTINDREGHANITEAENRAIRSAETAIQQSYINALSSFLTTGSKR
ncbi:MAG: LPP20 family lipoprotein [Treponema sp.]|jgi:hypothetical protein|nr:LPP20 family lipoprotein [Treponema sp.]